MLSKSSKKTYNNTNEETARSLDQIGSNAATIINLKAAGTKKCVQSEQTHKFPRQGLLECGRNKQQNKHIQENQVSWTGTREFPNCRSGQNIPQKYGTSELEPTPVPTPQCSANIGQTNPQWSIGASAWQNKHIQSIEK